MNNTATRRYSLDENFGRLAFIFLVFAGCLLGGPVNVDAADQPVEKKQVLCTTFPIYQIARNVAAGSQGIQLALMLPSSMGCPHDYVLTPQDMNRISQADVLIINGQGMESFLGDSLRRSNPKANVIDSSAGIKDLISLSPEPSGGIGVTENETTGDQKSGTINPHLFASPRRAAKISMNIANGLARIDPSRAALYDKNARAYATKLDKLAGDLIAVSKAFHSPKIVTEHAVFDYLARDAGLQIMAVVEEEPGQEPSASEMMRIVSVIKKTGAGAVFAEPQYPAEVARTIAREAGVPSAVLDPVATGPDDAPLDYYETVMRRNLETLKKTLGYEPRK